MKLKRSEKTNDLNMGWTTVYVTGKSDFREEVLKKLESSNVNFMPGYTGPSDEPDAHELYWLDDSIDLRKFKEAIGGKLIWKYRLQFFTSLEAFIESKKNRAAEDELTQEENDLLSQIQAAEFHSE
jgi:hypothetical protein